VLEVAMPMSRYGLERNHQQIKPTMVLAVMIAYKTTLIK